MFEGVVRETGIFIQKGFFSLGQGEGVVFVGLVQIRGLGSEGIEFEFYRVGEVYIDWYVDVGVLQMNLISLIKSRFSLSVFQVLQFLYIIIDYRYNFVR